MKHHLVFVATTPFAVNAFLRTHLLALAQNHDVTLCVNTKAYPLVEDISLVVKVRHVDIARKIAPLQDLRALLQLWQCFRTVRPSVVHSLTPKAGLLAMIAAWLVRVPLRWHTFTGQVWANKTGVVRVLMKVIDQWIAACATQVFADSGSQCALLCAEGVVNKGQISMLGCGSIAGVDLKRFIPNAINHEDLRRRFDVDPNVCVFLFVGRLARDKGVFDLIQAFQELASTLSNIQLWVVGPDDEDLLQELQSTVKSSVAPIRWVGATKTPEYFMSAADVLVLPSYREGFGSVIIEAAACSIPAIAYRVDGVIDAVVDGTTGLLVEVGQNMALAAAMKRLALDRALRNHLGQQARERVLRDFNSEQVTHEWLEFYRSQLDKQR